MKSEEKCKVQSVPADSCDVVYVISITETDLYCN